MEHDELQIVAGGGTLRDFLSPSTYPSVNWVPLPDITAYELALCLSVLLDRQGYHIFGAINALPEAARRHFQVTQ